MEKVKKGDVKAFEKLYERFKRPLFSYFLHWVKRESVAEELTQELFIRVYSARESYEPSAKVSTWMWTIARNLSIDHQRKKKESFLEPKEDDNNADPMERIESPLGDAESILLQKISHQHLEHCLEELNAQQKEAMLLRVFSDLAYEEICSLMDVSLSAVKSLLFRAKNGLLECFKKRGYHEALA